MGQLAARDGSLSEVSDAFSESFGLSLADAQRDFEDWPKHCTGSQYRDDSGSCESARKLDCSLADENGDLEIELELGCASAGVVGTSDGSARVELPFSPERNPDVYISGSWPSEDAAAIFGECRGGCDDRHTNLALDSEIDQIVGAGETYFIRVTMPHALADGTAQFRIRNLCDGA